MKICFSCAQKGLVIIIQPYGVIVCMLLLASALSAHGILMPVLGGNFTDLLGQATIRV